MRFPKILEDQRRIDAEADLGLGRGPRFHDGLGPIDLELIDAAFDRTPAKPARIVTVELALPHRLVGRHRNGSHRKPALGLAPLDVALQAIVAPDRGGEAVVRAVGGRLAQDVRPALAPMRVQVIADVDAAIGDIAVNLIDHVATRVLVEIVVVETHRRPPFLITPVESM